MTDSFLDNAGGWTPVPDALVRKYGFETAYVWGKVWRYCQMDKGKCTASHETIAQRAGMSRRTLIDKLNILIKDGYIEDLTPDLKNKPHTYCTKIGEEKIASTMQISHTEKDISTEEPNKIEASESLVSMRNLHNDNAENAQSTPSTMQNLHSESAKNAQQINPAMQNLHLKKEESLKTESKKEKVVNDINSLFVHFLEISKLPPPSDGRKKQAWESDLVDIYEMAENDPEAAKGLMDYAVGILDQKNYVINSPHGLLATCQSEAGRQKRARRNQEAIDTPLPPTPDSDLPPPPAPTPDQVIWQQVLADSPQIPQWLAAEITPIQRANGTFKLTVSSDNAKQWIDNRLMKLIRPALIRIDKTIKEIEVIVQ